MPPKKAKIPEKNAKDAKGRKLKEDQNDAQKITLTPGIGWSTDNFIYMKTVPQQQVCDELYNMFGIPMEMKEDTSKPAVQVFVEFQLSSFNFAQQFQDAAKAMSVIAILSDYIASVPAFSNTKDSFSQWVEKATAQIQSFDFTPNEQNTIIQYLNKNIRANAHIHHFVLTKEAVRQAESDGLKLFRSLLVEKKDGDDVDDAELLQKQAEMDEQRRLLEQSMKEKREAEEKERQEQLTVAIEEIIKENFDRIRSALEQRNESLLSTIMSLEEKIDGNVKKR